MRQRQHTQYRKAKADDSEKQFPVSRFTGRPYILYTVGKVHLQFKNKTSGGWRFACGKRDAVLWGVRRWEVVPDSTPVTCLRCLSHAPDIIPIFAKDEQQAFDGIPDIMEFQDEEGDRSNSLTEVDAVTEV